MDSPDCDTDDNVKYFNVADALLADLQNSISPGSRTAGYGSLRARGGTTNQEYATVTSPKPRPLPTSVSVYLQKK